MAKKPDFSIEEYRAKRNFHKTPEPAPGAPSTAGPEPWFVVQRHEASHLHYDLRLEMDGVLKSFAVPRGFSYVPADKHLAVRTEDHPMEYLEFDGVIPKGEYGAGTMTIWDRGNYVLLNPEEGLEKGKLDLVFFGGRLRGEWHLVKTSRGEKDWLIFKVRDRYAREGTDPVFPLDLFRRKKGPLPKRPKAMRAGGAVEPFSHLDWLFELEFAGRRVLAALEDESIRFLQADGTLLRVELPHIAAELRQLRAARALLDGVLVATDEQQRPDADLLEQRLAAGETDDLVYYGFDLLYYEEWRLESFPLQQRKRALISVLPALPHVLYVDHVNGRGEELLEVVRAGALPGVVAKHADSKYVAGESSEWRRIPAPASKARGKAGKNVLEALPQPKRGTRTFGRRVKISNYNKVYWPQEGYTKGQLLEYYDDVAEVLLPYLKERPIHMLRYPDGIEGKWFYHKKVMEGAPDWLPTTEVAVKDGEPIHYVVCDDRDTLLYLVNLGSIDLHPWMSRVGSLESPDYAIIDLDPMDSDFTWVIRIAQFVGKLLRGAGMTPFLKTSGATGLHVYIPLQPGYTYEHSRMFCEMIARMAVRELKDIATVERSVDRRGNKVYVDYLQNIKEQTVVPPYVVRPVPGAQVSMPLDWDELTTELRPSDFCMLDVRERLSRVGDLFRGVLDEPQDLMVGLRGLERM